MLTDPGRIEKGDDLSEQRLGVSLNPANCPSDAILDSIGSPRRMHEPLRAKSEQAFTRQARRRRKGGPRTLNREHRGGGGCPCRPCRRRRRFQLPGSPLLSAGSERDLFWGQPAAFFGGTTAANPNPSAVGPSSRHIFNDGRTLWVLPCDLYGIKCTFKCASHG